MKKLVLGLAVASLVLSCKKVPEGGNKGVLKLKDGVEKYDDHEVREGGVHAGAPAHAEAGKINRTVVDLDLKGAKIKGYQDGFEQKIITFLGAEGYTKATSDDELKNTWYNFDNINFKMGSTNQLEAGSEGQIQNLAAILKAYPDTKIKIGGYTDNVGDPAVNKRISQGRADFIKAELTKLGVGAQVLEAEGYGSEFATVPATASDEERAVDRKMAVRFAK